MAGEVKYGKETSVNEEALRTLKLYASKLERREMLNGEEMSTLMEIYRMADEAITKVGELAKEMAGEPEEREVLRKGDVIKIGYEGEEKVNDLNQILEGGVYLVRRNDGKVVVIESHVFE